LIHDGEVQVARAVMQVHDDGSLTFAGAIVEGDEVQFGFADIENLLDDSNRKYDILASRSVESIFVFSCIARYTLVGKEIEAETLQMQHIATTAGAFTYGEFYHDASLGRNLMLNQTMTALALSEGGTPKLQQKRQRRRHSSEATYARALSHFLHEVTGELERALQSERHSKEMMVKQSRQATMGEMIEQIAHQWRQPLNVVALTLQDLYIKGQLGVLDSATLESLYSKANSSIQYLSETIDDFRNFLKPDVAPESFDLNDFFLQMEPLLAGLLSSKGVQMDVSVQGKCELFSRKNELRQVVVSLINNAVEAMQDIPKKDRRITIECRHAFDKVIIQICDSGPGISEDIIHRIFDPYFTTKSKQNGTGLGLYIASQIVQKSLEGTLEAKSTEEGACFMVSIPPTLRQVRSR
jgi:signal transduction histidine kinase